MIRLTERAAAGLREILSANRASRETGVKLVPNAKGGVGMIIDQAAEGDEVVDGGNRPLLIVDSTLAPQLDGAVVDVNEGQQAGDGPQFILKRQES